MTAIALAETQEIQPTCVPRNQGLSKQGFAKPVFKMDSCTAFSDLAGRESLGRDQQIVQPAGT